MASPRSVTLLFIRHGQAQPAQPGWYGGAAPLTELGEQQAGAVAKALEKKQIHALYSSPYERARLTAAPLERMMKQVATIDPRLREMAVAADRYREILKAGSLLDSVWEEHHRAADEETLGEFGERVSAFCTETAERHVGSTVAVVAHGLVTAAVVRWALGFKPRDPWQYNFELPNASISEIEYWPGGKFEGRPSYAAVKRVGDVAHLQGIVTAI